MPKATYTLTVEEASQALAEHTALKHGLAQGKYAVTFRSNSVDGVVSVDIVLGEEDSHA